MILFAILCSYADAAEEDPNRIIGKTLSIADQGVNARLTRVAIYKDANHVSVTVTCHFSEAGLGPDVTVTAEAPALVDKKFIRHPKSAVNRGYTPDGRYYCNSVIRESVNQYTVLSDQLVLIGEEIWTINP